LTGEHCLTQASALIVEDEVFIVGFIESVLKNAGFGRVEYAMTLADACDALDQPGGFDVVILDARLPDGDTHALAQDLLGQGQSVVFHSGTAEPQLVSKFQKAVFCQKPSTPEKLLDGIKTSLRLAGEA
jgi:DNA-binding NtrC family response regulator